MSLFLLLNPKHFDVGAAIDGGFAKPPHSEPKDADPIKKRKIETKDIEELPYTPELIDQFKKFNEAQNELERIRQEATNKILSDMAEATFKDKLTKLHLARIDLAKRLLEMQEEEEALLLLLLNN